MTNDTDTGMLYIRHPRLVSRAVYLLIVYYKVLTMVSLVYHSVLLLVSLSLEVGSLTAAALAPGDQALATARSRL